MSTKWTTYILPIGGLNWHTKIVHCSLLYKDELQEKTKNWEN